MPWILEEERYIHSAQCTLTIVKPFNNFQTSRILQSYAKQMWCTLSPQRSRGNSTERPSLLSIREMHVLPKKHSYFHIITMNDLTSH